MSIDRKTVDHVAMLARLALTEEERERAQEQLSAILEHINVITEADTSQVPATAHILPVENVMAADTSRPSWNISMSLPRPIPGKFQPPRISSQSRTS